MRLHELRSHPDVNKKVSRDDQLKAIADKYGTDNIFITFTEINKFGTNVGTKYITPVGIYAFPLGYALKYGAKNLPVFSSKPYIQVFRNNTPKENTWVLSGKFNETVVNRIAEELPKYKIYNNREIPKFTSNKWLWDFLYSIEDLSYYSDQSNVYAQTVRKLLLNAGVYAVMDNGKAIIHANEPAQSIFFKKEYLTHLDTIVYGQRQRTYIDYTQIKDKSHLAAAMKSKGLDAMDAYMLATSNKELRTKGFEDLIKTSPMAATFYAMNILDRPWPEAEPVIVKNKIAAARYADEVLKDKDPNTWAERYKKEHNL